MVKNQNNVYLILIMLSLLMQTH